MGFTGLLALIIVTLLVITLKFVIDGAREKNWKKSIISVVIFCAIVFLMYLGLIRFITLM